MIRKTLWSVPAALVLVALGSVVGCDRSVSSVGPNGKTGEQLVGGSCNTLGETVACGASAVTTCYQVPESGAPSQWSTCIVPDCDKGETRDCPSGGSSSCEVDASGKWAFTECVSSSGSTPLVLSFDGGAVSFSNPAGVFGLDPTRCVATDWPSAATPWLALDRNGDGKIEDGGELFGSATMLASGEYAKNGFQALAELDENHDGIISAADPAFAKLVVWTDKNQDRASDPSELVSLSSLGVESISLDYGIAPHCDARGNCEIETARFVFRTGVGERKEGRIVDVHLAHH